MGSFFIFMIVDNTLIMNIEILKKHLGMAIHFVYYHHENLYKEQVFPEGYWLELCQSANIKYWETMYDCLDYALKKEGYCIEMINHPHKEEYSRKDIMTFFEKFYLFLKEHLGK